MGDKVLCSRLLTKPHQIAPGGLLKKKPFNPSAWLWEGWAELHLNVARAHH